MSENITVETRKSIWNSPYFIMIVLMMGVFIMAIDAYVFSPAITGIVAYFKTSYNWVAWTLTIYMLFSTAVMPLAGKLADIYGRKRIYIIGVSLFIIGSFACSISWNIYSLVTFRAIQAIGGGIILPAALSAMGSAAPPDKQGKTMGALMAMSALALVIGPNIGGYLIQNFGWRTIFYINIPIGILSILLALKFKETYGEAKHHLDIFGAAMLGGSLAALLYGLVRLENLPLTDITVFPLFLVSAALFFALILFEKRTKEPILNIPLVSRGDVLSLMLAMLATSVGLTAALFFVPTFAQAILRENVQNSGTLLTPLAISLFFFAIIGGILLDKIGAKPMLILGSVVSIASFYGMAYYVTNSTSLVIMLVIGGAGFGLGMGAYQVLILAMTPGTDKGTSSGLLNTFKGIGGAIGPVIGGFFLTDAVTNKIYTVSQAFTYIFLFAMATSIIALVLLAYLAIISRQKNYLSVPVPAQ
jgi:EmrB/QacA subfamily drug resistance transporter